MQLLSSDFESFEFGVLTTFSMATPPPNSLIKMPFVSARHPNLEIFFKESWVVEPNYAVTVKRGEAGIFWAGHPPRYWRALPVELLSPQLQRLWRGSLTQDFQLFSDFPMQLFVPSVILQPIDHHNKWLLRDFPGDYLYEYYCEGASAFSGSVKNQYLLYGLFHILNFQAN